MEIWTKSCFDCVHGTFFSYMIPVLKCKKCDNLTPYNAYAMVSLSKTQLTIRQNITKVKVVKHKSERADAASVSFYSYPRDSNPRAAYKKLQKMFL